MTLTFELDPGSVKMNQRAKYLGHKWFSSKVIARTPWQIHTPDRLLYPNHWWWVDIHPEESWCLVRCCGSSSSIRLL